MHLYFVPDVDARQVLPHFQWSGISFSVMRYKFRCVERHDMRIDSQFRLCLAAEDRSGLLRSGVVIDYFLLSQVAVKVIAGSVRFGINYLANQHIRALSEVDEILAVPRIAREDYRMPCVIDPVAECRLDQSVIDGERSDLKIAVLVNHPLLDVFGYDHDTLGWQSLIYIAPDVNIELVGLLQMRHHLRRASRSPDAKRRVPAENPACQIEIGNSDNGIGAVRSAKETLS